MSILKHVYIVIAMAIAAITSTVSHAAHAAPIKIKRVMSVKSGTGFFVSPRHLVTNYHVANGCQRVVLRQSGSPDITANVIGFDPRMDLAVIETAKPVRHNAYLRTDGGLKRGDSLNVIGYPEGHSGNGSYMARAKVLNPSFTFNGISGVQFTNSVDHGNSGGPLLDEAGNVIGVVVGKMSHYGNTGMSPYKEYGVAIGLNVLRNFLAQQGVTPMENVSVQHQHPANQAESYTVNVRCISQVREMANY